MSNSPASPGPDLFFAGGDCVTRFGTLVRRTDLDLEAASREIETRNDIGRFVDGDGFIRNAKIDLARVEWLSEAQLDARNQIVESENFASLEWVNSRSVDAASSIPNPINEGLSTKLNGDATAASTHYIFQSRPKAIGAQPFTFSCFLRAQQFSHCELQISDATNVDRLSARFFFGVGSEPTADAPTANNTWIPGTSSVEKVAIDWVRCTISGISDVGSTIRVNIFLDDGNGVTFDGDNFSGFNIFGAMLEEGDLERPTVYQATPISFERNTPSLMLENPGRNEVVFSDAFDGVNWVKNRVSVSANAQVAPDKLVTADRIIEDASLDSHLVQQATDTLVDNILVTASVYVRAAERRWIKLTLVRKDGLGVSGFFDCSALADGGKLGTIEPGVRGAIERVANDYFRISITADIVSGATAPVFQIFLAVGDNNASYQGDGASSAFLWGAQVDQDPSATSYIPTSAGLNVNRQPDIFNGPFPHPPQEQTLYLKFQERGTVIDPLGLFGIQDQFRSNPRLEIFGSASINYALQHTNAAGVISTTSSPLPIVVGDIVELVGILYEDGSVRLNNALNGGEETEGGRGVPVAFSPAWSDELVWLNSVGSGSVGITPFLSVKVTRGVRDLAFMRAL